MKLKLKLFFLLLLLTSVFNAIIYSSNSFVQQESVDIIQIPKGAEINVGSSINLTLEFHDTSIVDSVYLLYCSIEPEFYCHFPAIPLNDTNHNSFMGVFIPEYEIGTVMGYHFSVHYNNGTSIELPNISSFLNNKTNIRQAEDNMYYFVLRIIEEYNTNNYETSWFNFFYLFSSVLLIRWKRRTNNY